MVEERLPWFPCYQSKLLGALAGMPFDAGYIYSVILLRTYEVGGPCPDSHAVIARRVGATEKRVAKAVEWLISQSKLRLVEGGLTNSFAEKVLIERESTSNRLIVAGKKGGEKSAQKRLMKTKNGAKPGLTQAEARLKPGSSKLHIHKQEEEESLFSNENRVCESGWPNDWRDQFWASYPRRHGKKSALAKLEAVRKSGTVSWAVLLAGVMRYVDHVRRKRTEERYIKQPTTWINGGCWDDEYAQEGIKPINGAGEDRTHCAAGAPTTRDAAVIAGMDRALAQRRAARASADGGRFDVRGKRDGPSDGDDTERSTANGDGSARRGTELVVVADAAGRR